MSRLLAAMRNPYVLMGQGFLFGALVVIFSQDGREAVATPVPIVAASHR